MREKIENYKKNENLYRSTKSEMKQLIADFERERDLSRTWFHIDMDMYFAAVEIRDNPSLEGKPIAVGDNSMLSTANYIARKYGIK